MDFLARLFVVRYIDIPRSLVRMVTAVVVLVVLGTAWTLFEIGRTDMLAFMGH